MRIWCFIIVYVVFFASNYSYAYKHKITSITINTCSDHFRRDFIDLNRVYLVSNSKMRIPLTNSLNTFHFKQLKKGEYELIVFDYSGVKHDFKFHITETSNNSLFFCFDYLISREIDSVFDQLGQIDTIQMFHIETSCLSGVHHNNMSVIKSGDLFSIKMDDRIQQMNESSILLFKQFISELFNFDERNLNFRSTNSSDIVQVLFYSSGSSFTKYSDNITHIVNYFYPKLKAEIFSGD